VERRVGMELRVKRTDFSEESTIGELSMNGQFECYTLEDKVRPLKIAGKTAIPGGRYEVVISFSQRFQRPLPLLLNVPNFEGIRIHPGNKAANTEGCILVGETKSVDYVGQSRVAFDRLFEKLKVAAVTEKIFMEIA
jgi:Family of unknown function (DUF5675)